MAVTEEPSSGRPLWVRAIAVTAVVVTVILAARQLRPLVTVATFVARTGHPVVGAPPSTAWVRVATWLAVATAVLLRLRIAAALGAWAAVAYEVVVLALAGVPAPGFRDSWPLRLWPLLLAIGAAVLLTASVRVRDGLGSLRHGGRWLLAGAAAVIALSAMAVPLLGTYYPPPPPDPRDFFLVFGIRSDFDNAIHIGTPLIGLVLVLAAIGYVERGVRPRVYALIAIIVSAFVGLQLGMPSPFDTNDVVPVPPRPVLAALLVVVPCAAFGTGLLLIRFVERARVVG
jgi:hypothetical protein